MNNRLKFRGKLLHTGEFVCGNLIRIKGGGAFIIPQEVCEEDGHHLSIASDFPYWVDIKTVGQCTGRKDKNGELTFEGDRIRMTDTLGTIFEGKITRNKFNEIIFQEEEQGGEYYLSDCLRIKKPKNTIEITGNIYEDKKKDAKLKRFGSTFEALEWLVNNRDKEIIFRFKDEDNDDIERYRFSDISEEFEYCWKMNGEWSGWSKDDDNIFKCPECWFDIKEYYE